MSSPANIVVTAVSGKNYYKVDFGIYASQLGIAYRFFWGEDIELIDKDGHVSVHLNSIGENWQLSTAGSGKVLIVDSVLGSVPADDDELATLIANLRG